MKIVKAAFLAGFFIVWGTALYAQQRALIWVDKDFDVQSLAAKGFKINATAGDVLSIQWQGDLQTQLQQTKGIKYIEQGGKVVPAKQQDSLSLVATRASQLHTNYQAYGFPNAITGKGVIVGVVDIGFQLDHPTFYDRSGQKNRIVRYWNQQNNEGSAPQGYNYGTLYTDISQVSYRNNKEAHGTHVAGIAAGSGYGTPNYNQSGIAYDADIVVVEILYQTNTIPAGACSDYLVANPSIIDAFDYIFKYADSVGKPAVINLSWGMHTGPHDGTSVFDRALDNLVGKGKVIVGSAGNSRGGNIHFYHQFANDTVSAWVGEGINRKQTLDEQNYIDLWGDPNTDFSVQLHLFDTLGNKRFSTPFITSTFDKDTLITLADGDTTLSCLFQCKAKSALNGKPNILLQINSNYPEKNYVVARFTSNNTTLHGWNSGGIERYTSGGFGSSFKGIQPFANMKIGDNNYISGENGGTANGIITVGAYATAYVWTDINGAINPTYGATGYLASFSSAGPTVDGRIKPDICAPGLSISSALNKYAYDNYKDLITQKSILNGDTNYYVSFGGTSMASPQVAGAVALMLQQNPNLTNINVRDILRQTAATDTFTKAVPNNLYGWGKLNVLAAVQEVAGTTSIHSAGDAENNIIVYPNPVKEQLNILNNAANNNITAYQLYNLQGQLLLNSGTVQQGTTLQINTSQLKQGLYLLHISTPQGVITRKISKN